jgi:hypothetical protein
MDRQGVSIKVEPVKWGIRYDPLSHFQHALVLDYEVHGGT